MRYYVTADVHSYFSEFKEALAEKGFFTDTAPRKLVICGDLYDRGTEALALQAFVLSLMEKDQVILIRGNHEDMAVDLLHRWNEGSYRQTYHHRNGTMDTVCQLTGYDTDALYTEAVKVGQAFGETPFIQTIIPAMVDYYETEHYIFTHGWIPCTMMRTSNYTKQYVPIEEWRHAGRDAWDKARWLNGMEAAHAGVLAEGKTIVCGHWHCSFGHTYYDNDGEEFGRDANFSPYYGKGIIALDACTAYSHKVNCIVIDDAPLPNTANTLLL